jgi:hypothetical protein
MVPFVFIGAVGALVLHLELMITPRAFTAAVPQDHDFAHFPLVHACCVSMDIVDNLWASIGFDIKGSSNLIFGV